MWQGKGRINKDCKADKYYDIALQVSVRTKYNYVHENALWKKKKDRFSLEEKLLILEGYTTIFDLEYISSF